MQRRSFHCSPGRPASRRNHYRQYKSSAGRKGKSCYLINFVCTTWLFSSIFLMHIIIANSSTQQPSHTPHSLNFFLFSLVITATTPVGHPWVSRILLSFMTIVARCRILSLP